MSYRDEANRAAQEREDEYWNAKREHERCEARGLPHYRIRAWYGDRRFCYCCGMFEDENCLCVHYDKCPALMPPIEFEIKRRSQVEAVECGWAAGDWLRLIRLEEEAWRLNNWSENPYYTGTTVDSQSVARQAKLLAEIATLKAANRAAMDAFEKLSPVEEVRP